MVAAGALAPPPWSPTRVARRVRCGSVLVVAAAGVTGVLAHDASARLGPALLVLAALLGLPHGAVDHLALGWSEGRLGAARPGVVLGYAVAAVAVAAAALVAPLPGIIALLVLSAAHFAEGERGHTAGMGWWPAAAAGVTVVVFPLLAHPAAVAPLLRTLDPGLPVVLTRVHAPVLALTAALIVIGLVAALREGDLPAAGELALLSVVAGVAPPLVFFSVWFAGWHAPRHLVRLLVLEPRGDTRERIGRLARGAALPTSAAVLGLVAMYAVLGGLPGAALVVLLALTVPHAAVVARIGRGRISPCRTVSPPARRRTSSSTATTRSTGGSGLPRPSPRRSA